MKKVFEVDFLVASLSGRDTVTVESSNAVTTEFMTPFREEPLRGGQEHTFEIGEFKVHPIRGLLPERLKKVLYRRPPTHPAPVRTARLVAQSMRYSPYETAQREAANESTYDP